MLKDILVHIDDRPPCAARLTLAMSLAQVHEAHLTGAYVVPQLALPYYGEMPVPTDLIEAEAKASRAAADRCENEFREAMENSGLASQWRCVTGYAERELALQSRYADLLVVGQSSNADYLLEYRDVPDRVVLGAACPVLLVPDEPPRRAIGKHALLAWNGSRESVRAVNDSLPLLADADRVDVLSFNPPAEEGELPTAEICTHLARHGIKTEGHRIDRKDQASGSALLQAAVTHDSDLIVMGAYGHGRWHELILGGTTQYVLENTTLPVLMSH